jgi:hypothetical protein
VKNDTPRTDAAETNWWSEDGLRSAFIVRAEFARELEREMEQLRKERDEARRECRLLLLGQEVLRGVRDLPTPPDDLVTIVPVPRKEDGK